jgi:hypothetical protein
MKRPLFRLACHTFAAMLLAFGAIRAGNAGAVDFNDGNGRLWRLVVVSGQTALNEIDRACPRDGATTCVGSVGTQNLSGWVWGTDTQVTQMFGAFAPDILSSPTASIGGPQYITPVNTIFNTFGYTMASKGCPTYQPCWNMKAVEGVTSSGSVSAPNSGRATHDIEWGSAYMSVGPAYAPSLTSAWYGVWQWRSSGLGTDQIFAYDDVGTSPSPAGGIALNVLNNDWVAGAIASSSNVSLVAITALPAGLTLNADGSVFIAAGVAAGTYGFSYRICALTNPANCDEADVTIAVKSYAISAMNDSAIVLFGKGASAAVNVLANDKLGGVTATPTTVLLTTLSTSHPGVTLNSATGNVSVAPGTSNGPHTLVYRICERANTANCAQATVSLYPTAIYASADYWRLSSKYGASSPSVLANDSVGGVPATAANVITSLTTPLAQGITFNAATGVFTVAPKTSSGTYVVGYQICEAASAANCMSTTATLELSGRGGG